LGTERLNLNMLTIFARAENLITWTEYPGLDPEVFDRVIRHTIRNRVSLKRVPKSGSKSDRVHLYNEKNLDNMLN
jgi:hypothetical protein